MALLQNSVFMVTNLQKNKYKDKGTQTKTKTYTKCLQDPMYSYIFFLKSRGFKDLKYYIGCDETDKEKDKDPILCIFRVEYFLGVNIFQE